MTEDRVRELVRKRSSKTSVYAWCHQNGVNRHHTSEFLNGRSPPRSDLLAALGLEFRIVRKRRDGASA